MSSRARSSLIVLCGLVAAAGAAAAADPEVLRPRVPADQIEAARAVRPPFALTEDATEAGRKLFQGKAFCASCHGREGKGMGDIPGLVGRLPRNFTDRAWQAARTDGELFWILQ